MTGRYQDFAAIAATRSTPSAWRVTRPQRGVDHRGRQAAQAPNRPRGPDIEGGMNE
jgi:hypothetical protein